MKNIKDFQLFEAAIRYRPGGVFVVEQLLEIYKQRIDTVKKIIKDHNYKVIAELLDGNSFWKVYIVLESETGEFNQAQFSKLYAAINDLLPSVDQYTGKRFLSRADVRNFGMNIEEWQKSDILVKANQASGVLENDKYEEYVSVEVWMDWA